MRSSLIKTRQPGELTLPLDDEYPARSSIIIVFAPTRTRIQSVTLNGISFDQAPGFAGFVWHLEAPFRLQRAQTIFVKFVGDAPSLLSAPAFAPGVNALDLDLLTRTVQSALKRLLDERGDLVATGRDPDDELRGFFFRYDAWSQPLLSEALADPTFEKSLKASARDVFYKGMSGVTKVPSKVYERLAGDLSMLYRCRARDFHSGKRGHDILDYLEDRRKAFLVDIEEVAPFQERLFESGFKDCTSMQPAALAALRKALWKFAVGRLHFKATPVPKLPPKVSPLNAEPDSILFLAFTEVAIHASNQSKVHKEFWFWLARTFAGLIEPFTLVYGDSHFRAPCKYRPGNRRPDRVVDEDVADRLDTLEQRMPDSTWLARRLEPFYAAAALAAMHDEITAPFSVCK